MARQKVKRLILSALALAFLIVGVAFALPPETRTQPAFAGGAGASNKYDGDCTGAETAGRCADKPFSHEYCQYPDRWSNPVDGCDNSDPAVPECIRSFSTKAGEDACIAAFVAAQQQPVTPAQPSGAAQCGGK